ncbi:MAG: hypothetical protein OEM52_12960 [bacterium]|nr:hypothetical protein [bacterium]
MALTAMTGANTSLYSRIPFIRSSNVRRYKGYPFLVECDSNGRVLNVIGKMKNITTQGVEGLIKDGRDIRQFKGRIVMVIRLGSSEQKGFMIGEMNDEFERLRRRVRQITSAAKPPTKTAVTDD